MSQIYPRTRYIAALERRRGSSEVKVVTGMRRSGKTFLLRQLFVEHLRGLGVDNDHIINLSLDRLVTDNEDVFSNAADVTQYIRSRLIDKGQYYVLIDEIQYLPDFERFLNGLNDRPNVDVYVTGSNSHLLSSDINTIFRGRSDEVHVMPLTFAEMVAGRTEEPRDLLQEYMLYGGLPRVCQTADLVDKERYLKRLWDATYMTDVVDRYRLRNRVALGTVVDALCSNIGSFTNAVNVSNALGTNLHVKLSSESVCRYLQHLEEAYLFRSAQLYDVRGGRYYSTRRKWYATDVGLRNARLDFRQRDKGHLLENIVFNELIHRGYQVDVGAIASRTMSFGERQYRTLEIDFVCNLGSRKVYVQVTYGDEEDQEVMDRELRPLEMLRDNFEKVLIHGRGTLSGCDNMGIFHLDILDFLLDRGPIRI